MSYRQVIAGGRAAGLEPKDFDPEQLKIGTRVELEHTDDPFVAREIAMDHLAEHPDYYRALEQMEKQLFESNPSGHYVLVQEPRRRGVYIRCRNVDQCLRVVEGELTTNLPGTRITMIRKRPRQHAELLAMWRLGPEGARRYRINGGLPS